MSYRESEHHEPESCSRCHDTGRVGSVYDGYEPCECTDEPEFTCPDCGREIDRENGACPTPDYVCGWVSDDYDPTSSELESWYDGPSEAERIERAYRGKRCPRR